jgi:hypothetical protein
MYGVRWAGWALSVLVVIACADANRPSSPAASSGRGATSSGSSSQTGGASGGSVIGGSGGTTGAPKPDAAMAGRGTVVGGLDGGTVVPDAAPIDSGEAGADAQPSTAAEHSTTFWSGGLNHLSVHKVDRERGYCVSVLLVWPSAMRIEKLELPMGWSMERIVVSTETEGDCSASAGAVHIPVAQAMVEGRVAFGDPGPTADLPCSLDVDLHVTLPAMTPIPATDHLLATDVPVECTL